MATSRLQRLHRLELGQVGVDDLGERDVVELDLLAQDQVEQQVEGAFEHRGGDLVGHRDKANHIGVVSRNHVRVTRARRRLRSPPVAPRLLRHPALRRADPRHLPGRPAPVRGRPGRHHLGVLHRRPPRHHRAPGPGRAAPAHPRHGGALPGQRHRPRRQHPVRAEPRGRAHPAGLADGVHRQLRRAEPDDAVQGEVRPAEVRVGRAVHLPGADGGRHPPLRHRPGAGGRRPAPAPRAHPRRGRAVQQPLRRRPSSCPRPTSPRSAPGSWTSRSPPARCRSRSTRRRAPCSCSTTRRRSSGSSSGPSPTTTARSATTRPPSRACRTCSSILGRRHRRRPGGAGRRGTTQYGPLKADTAAAVIELLRPIQARYAELRGRPRRRCAELLAKGADQARAIAEATLARAQQPSACASRGSPDRAGRRSARALRGERTTPGASMLSRRRRP